MATSPSSRASVVTSVTRAPWAAARSVVWWTGGASLALLAPVVVGWGPLTALDRWVAEATHASAVESPWLVRVSLLLTDWLWDPWAMRLLAALAVVALWRRGQRWVAGRVAGVSALALVVQQGLKAAVGRDRPRWADPVDGAAFAAFPSGHALTAAVTCGLLWWAATAVGRAPGRAAASGWAVVAGVSVLGVGLTRVYLGVHWASDVVGGWLLGLCLAAAAAARPVRVVRRP
ncbi:phosphatase PAP2 family protein [Streptomyces sp. MUM 203J]|uniref:phosphatase PAP2 family protein n=1 Tax=Streptomyces sp. MUM 203J TaxID=2791990 RepID=UPI001F036ED5|nr:phosphatase PAP2 family protein [Streptomyces sp. MUM 203J]MCH0539970.1 phosphatase PAP2 family protein [Streptomyces sp. MUM 203J]